MKSSAYIKVTLLALTAILAVSTGTTINATNSITIKADLTGYAVDNNLDGKGDSIIADNLRVGEYDYQTYNIVERSFIRFSINPGTIPSNEQIVSAKFRIYLSSDAPIGSGNPEAGNYVDSFRGISDAKLYWSNNSKNFGNSEMTKELYGDTSFQNTNQTIVKTEYESGSTAHQSAGWIEVDVTSFIKAEFASQSSESTVFAWLRVQADLWPQVARGNGTGLRFAFENAKSANAPQLIITTAPNIPEPATSALLLASCIISTIFILRIIRSRQQY